MQKNTLINGGAVDVEDTLNVEKIVSQYKKDFNIDVAYLFEGTKDLQIVKCKETGFRFYYPLSVEGDNRFYSDLYSQHRDRLYQKTKWEFREAAKMIRPNSSVLDVGCGGGDFFDELKGKNCQCFGLDKSNYAGELLKSKGVEFSDEPIETFAEKNREKFDYVTGFQILEHVKQPGEFIKSMVKMLKKDGILIIAVPNNEPYFMKHFKYHTLNLPPHHMGLWNKESLTNMAPHFGLDNHDFKYEGFDYLIQFFKRKTGINIKPFSSVLKLFNNTLGKRTALAFYKKKPTPSI